MTKRKVTEIRGCSVKEHERKLDGLYFHIFFTSCDKNHNQPGALLVLQFVHLHMHEGPLWPKRWKFSNEKVNVRTWVVCNTLRILRGSRKCLHGCMLDLVFRT